MIKAKPNTPCEPTSEMALILAGAQICAWARGTLSEEAGALPIKITATTVARILVVRMGPAQEGNFRAPAYSQSGEQVVTTYTGRKAKALSRLCFSF